MKINLNLLEKFILEMASEKAKSHINECFVNLQKEHPGGIFVSGSQIMNHIVSQETPEGFAAVNGLLYGVILAYSSEYSDVEDYIKGFLEFKARQRGENVVDYFQLKADRKKKVK